jgi:flagellum-specific peptidoglycan hydrolase FlgJ
MMLKFFKSNWFSVALVLLVLVAIARKNVRIDFGQPENPKKREISRVKAEKFTDLLTQGEAPSQLGILADPSQPRKALPDIDGQTAIAYLRRFGNVAAGEHKKFGIPASVLLAYSYVNSFSGQRETVKQANNFFALGCSRTWEGRTADLDGRCYRRYQTPWESFRDFSLFVCSADWYPEARKSCGDDWRKWLDVLQANGLSDVDQSKAEMQKIIQQYRLFELDEK